MSRDLGPLNKYENCRAEKRKHIESVLSSSAAKKIVVGGPGTGKTSLFKEVLKDKSKTLTLTFINALVEDLSLDLLGISEVRTLHGFARMVLAQVDGTARIFPKLSQVIREDARILLGKEVDFDELFHERKTDNELVAFYETRRRYYQYYGFADIVAAAVAHFESNPNSVPRYDQVVVDEFQDFNKLEVSLIELLAGRSPTLLAGDDDQALYDFKHASVDHIRQRFTDSSLGFSAFRLPYCSRSTRVIVDAANDIVREATRIGCLRGRIAKEFMYFEDSKKDVESEQNPKIVHARQYAAQIPWFIQQQIGDIARQTRRKFSVLVITPTRMHCRTVVEKLREKGFESVVSVDSSQNRELAFVDGVSVLREDKASNLGWRVVAQFLLSSSEFEYVLKRTHAERATPLAELVGKEVRSKVNRILRVLRAVLNGKEVAEDDLANVAKAVGYDAAASTKNFLRAKLPRVPTSPSILPIKKIPIRVTTVASAKGLSGDCVFITHFDDQYFIKEWENGQISDRDVCNFLVALTRAKKKAFLISSRDKEPIFLRWIAADRVERMADRRRRNRAR
ncbi:MAG TPA: UvrD-helicase domain-containing protein [Terriglobia bacterium]|nr:UvrD-helicase domain-containing protein [Terriglobia bacterium]